MTTEQEHTKQKPTFTAKGAWMGLIAYLVVIGLVVAIIKIG